MVDLLTNINVFKALTIGLLAFIGLRMLLSGTTASRLADRLASLNALTRTQQQQLGWCMGVTFTAVLIYLRARQYFELQTMYDMTVEANVAWHMVHGPWFFNAIDNDSFLGGHFSPVFVLIGLVYRFAEHPITLLVIQSVAFGLGSIAVFYLVLSRQSTTSVALLAMALYMVNPYVHHSNAHDFHLSPLAIPAILWMLYFIDSNKPWRAVAAALFSFSIEESVLLPLASFGLYLVVFRPSWRMFGLVLTLASLAYFVVITKAIMPIFAPGNSPYFWDRYANLGSNLNEALYNLATHPFWAVMEGLIRRNQYLYLLYFLIPVAFLPLLSKEFLLLVVPVTIMFLSQNSGMNKLGFHYSALALPFLFYGMVCGLSKISTSQIWQNLWRKHHQNVFAGIFFLLALNVYRLPSYDLGKTEPEFAASAFELAKLIPQDASVATDMRFGPLLVNRHRLCLVHTSPGEICMWELESLSGQNWSKPLWQPEYVLLGVEHGKATIQKADEATAYAQWLTSTGYEEIKNQGGIRLFRVRTLAKESKGGIAVTGNIPASTVNGVEER